MATFAPIPLLADPSGVALYRAELPPASTRPGRPRPTGLGPRGACLTTALAALIFSPGLALSAAAQTPDSPLPALEPAPVQAVVDSIAREALSQGQAAGMSVAVARGTEILARGYYGSMELELEVDTRPESVYEIGSVTKQFTAAAILQLAEREELDLDGDLTDYLPDYPTGGRPLPLRRLLDHTSGITSYTALPEFPLLSVRHVPRDTLVATFASRPFDFEPGEAAIYNNSAYYLLGLVIEAVSGQEYAEYVEEHLFASAGMIRSSYCSETRITPGKAKGYSWTPEGLVHRDPIVHSHPYAAGSLCSTTLDLVAWNQALHGGRILREEAHRTLVTGGTLNDGTVLRYGGGISLTPMQGHRAWHHGGGINGFLSHLAYLPDHDLSVVVLVNTAGPVAPGAVAGGIVATLLGTEPIPEAQPLPRPAEQYEGTYEGVGLGAPFRVQISTGADGLQLLTGAGAGEPRPLRHLGSDRFAMGTQEFTFEWEGDEVVRIRADLGSNYSFLYPVPHEDASR